MKNNRFVLVAMALLAFVALPAWNTTLATAGNAPTEHAQGTIKRFVATPGADGVQRVEITGGEYYYDPNYIVVAVNKPVELSFKKAAGYIPHNLIVKAPEAGINLNVDMKNAAQTVKFTPTKIGKYPMYCDHKFLWFATHQEKGMEGVIEVVE